MYKLIIVDDEDEVRQGIIRKTNWERYNFKISGEAENGREALDIIEEDTPDVVITDINMPVMDGLELAAILKESFPTVITVILTGFDEFKFAQQAIKYGVADYILKPVLPKDIDELMEKLKDRIDSEVQQKEDVRNLRRHYAESLPIIRENFLVSLVTGRLGQEELMKRLGGLQLRLGGSRFIAAAACIDKSSLKASFIEGGDEGDDLELAKFAVFNISQEIADKRSIGEVFSIDDRLGIVAGFDEADSSAAFNRFYLCLEEIRQNVEKYLKIAVTFGIGRVCASICDLKDSYRTALTALEYKLVIGTNKVIFIDDVEPKNTETVFLDEGKEQKLVSCIKFGSEKDVTEALNSIFSDIAGVKATLKEYRLFFQELLTSISRLSRGFEPGISESAGNEHDLYAEFLKSNTLDEIKQWIKSHCIRLMKHISDTRRNATATLLDKAKDYIRQNYSDNELSIQKVANHLHISACYLSMIFKKEAGETFLKYLVGVRLAAAKDLLNQTEMKTSEIAEKIGYPDMNYFSYFFKKNFGLSPREYRNKYVLKKES